MHWLLMYTVSPDYLARRSEFRSAHLAKAWASSERGGLLLGGAVGDPPDRAMLLFEADSATVAETFAHADPYVLNGLVTRWEVLPWITVAGPLAASPVRT